MHTADSHPLTKLMLQHLQRMEPEDILPFIPWNTDYMDFVKNQIINVNHKSVVCYVIFFVYLLDF
jgi:hypothetical protein